MDPESGATNSNLVLQAVLFADAVEYSRLVLENESAALDLMRQSFQLFRGVASKFGGTFVKTTGDGVVLVFNSAIASVECAVAIQKELRSLNRSLPSRRQAPFRIGIHLGEVLYEDGDIYGHIVNVAARLQGLAEPGAVCMSEAVYQQARHKLNFVYRRLGQQHLKNMAETVSVYQISDFEPSSKGLSLDTDVVEISVLGGFAMGSRTGELADIRSPWLRALMGYLALHDHMYEFRDRLASLLLSDQSDQRSRKTMTSGLGRLKRALDRSYPELLSFDQQVVRLQSETVSVDLVNVSRELSENKVSEALVEGRVEPASILSGLEPVGPAFASWLKVTRHNWRNKLVRLLESYIADPEEVSDIQTRAATALHVLDATHELACRCLMKSHVMSGNAAAALRIYGELKHRLESEFGIEPSEETQRLAEEIRLGRPAHKVQTRVAERGRNVPPARLPRILVKSLQCNNDVGPVMHLFDGFRQELISSLVRFREWVIIQEGQSTERSLVENAHVRSSSVDYLVETTCAKYHSDYFMTVAFVHSNGSRYLWSERYILTLNSWTRTQSEIVRRIAGGMGIYLSTERVMTGNEDDISLEAYDKWLRGEHLLTMWSPETEREAETLFTEVIGEMPKFAPAYASLSGIYNVAHLINVGKLRDRDLEEKASSLAQEAVSIDPLDARTHLTMAWSFAMAGRFHQAELHYDLAIELNPNNPATLISCAQGLAFAGNYELANTVAKDALRLAPVLSEAQWAYLATARFMCGDLEGCVEASEMAGDVIVDVPGWKAAALVLMGRKEEAELAGRQLLAGIRDAWCGSPDAGDREMIEWMLQAYPIKNAADHAKLRDALDLALGFRQRN